MGGLRTHPDYAIQSRFVRTLITVFLLIIICLPSFAQNNEEGLQPMFNGRDLDGWDGDPRLWRVEDGEIVGSTEGVTLKGNTFLICKKTYGDFHIKLQAKVRNHNTGIQIRSEALPNWGVRGLQVDMAAGNYWGSIYDERGGRGTLVDGWEGKAEKVVKRGQWNELEVYCKGDLIRVWVNGLLTAELHDSVRLEGVIAIQLHRGPPMEVRVRDMRIRELP